MNAIAIGNTNIAIKEYKGQRVVTFKDIDTVHGRPDGTARRNFNRNKEHFIEGEDFFVRNSYEAKKEYSATAPNGLILLTESGYLMLAKSFTDKVAWDVQRALVKAYFRVKQEHTPEYEQLKLEEKPYVYVDKFYKGEPVLTSADIEYFSKINHTRIDHTLRRVCIEHADYIYLTHSELAEFKKENPKLVRNFSHAFVIFKSGFDKLMKHFGAAVETPKIMVKKANINAFGRVSETTRILMSDVRNGLKCAEALTYLLESSTSLGAFEVFQDLLQQHINRIGKVSLAEKTSYHIL